MAVLLVSHQLNLVARFADTMVLLHRGRVAAAGTPADVMRASVLEAVYEWPLLITRDPAVGAPALLPLRNRGPRSPSQDIVKYPFSSALRGALPSRLSALSLRASERVDDHAPGRVRIGTRAVHVHRYHDARSRGRHRHAASQCRRRRHAQHHGDQWR